jgi:protein-tyrosine phosphatase
VARSLRADLHFHLLPGVDDGPRDDAEAIELARLAVADGTRLVVATPHTHMLEIAGLPERVAELRARLLEADVELRVCGGGEISSSYAQVVTDTELDLLAQGPAGGRWVLLEAPLELPEIDFATAAAELRGRGVSLLIGHPERSPATPTEDIIAEVHHGAVLQINASSVVGRHGAAARRAALDLIRSGLPFVLASDAHSRTRPPLLTSAAAALAGAGIDAAAIDWAVDTGPSRLLTEGLVATNRSSSYGARGGQGR